MNGIINGDNLSSVLTAIFTGLAGLAVWRQGGKLGDEARHLQPDNAPGAKVGGLYVDTEGAKLIAAPLVEIAAVLREWWTATKHYRESRTEETLEEVAESLKAISDPDVLEAIREALRQKRGR